MINHGEPTRIGMREETFLVDPAVTAGFFLYRGLMQSQISPHYQAPLVLPLVHMQYLQLSLILAPEQLHLACPPLLRLEEGWAMVFLH